jgi:hypothetical protein
MTLRLSRLALLPIVIFSTEVAWAAPQITPLGEADKHGAIVYSVKCDSGAKKILQCVRDDQHCGYGGDASLSSLVSEACSANAPAASSPAPVGDAPPFQTSPAYP